MSVPTITLDSQHPGLMGLTLHERDTNAPVTVWLTLHEAEELALDIAATTRHGFMQSGNDHSPYEKAINAVFDRAAHGSNVVGLPMRSEVLKAIREVRP